MKYNQVDLENSSRGYVINKIKDRFAPVYHYEELKTKCIVICVSTCNYKLIDNFRLLQMVAFGFTNDLFSPGNHCWLRSGS